MTVRPKSGCTGRAFSWMSALKDAIWAASSSMGSVSTIQFTPSLQGGVVSEPS